MQLYFFDKIDRDGRRISDVDGELCRGIEDAKLQAYRLLREARKHNPETSSIEVRDRREGEPMFIVDDLGPGEEPTRTN